MFVYISMIDQEGILRNLTKFGLRIKSSLCLGKVKVGISGQVAVETRLQDALS